MKVLLTTILALALLGCVGGPTPAGGIVNPPAPSGEQAVSPVAVSIGSIGDHIGLVTSLVADLQKLLAIGNREG